jgi:hypothetical protein
MSDRELKPGDFRPTSNAINLNKPVASIKKEMVPQYTVTVVFGKNTWRRTFDTYQCAENVVYSKMKRWDDEAEELFKKIFNRCYYPLTECEFTNA